MTRPSAGMHAETEFDVNMLTPLFQWTPVRCPRKGSTQLNISIGSGRRTTYADWLLAGTDDSPDAKLATSKDAHDSQACRRSASIRRGLVAKETSSDQP